MSNIPLKIAEFLVLGLLARLLRLLFAFAVRIVAVVIVVFLLWQFLKGAS